MWIKKIHIENYKSLKEVDIELNEGVNVFIGKNNTGKSNIVDALMFLSKAVRNENISDQYKEIVFGKDIKNEIKFDLEFTVLDVEWKDVFVKLQLEPDISFDVFKERISNKIGYAAKFRDHDRSFYLFEEEVCIYFEGGRVVFAKSFWNEEGKFEKQIIENLKDRINTNTGDLVFCGGGSPPDSILHCSHTPIRPEENLLISLYKFISSFKNLNPIRSSPESMEVYGGEELKSDGSNLPRVLNTIASSNRELFATIIRDIRTIIEDISEINAPLLERSSTTFLSTTEKYFGDIGFGWDHISAGTKEIIYLVTFLRTAPLKGLIIIEEPELHLHAGAIIDFFSLLENISSEDDKQILLNTHSFMLIELTPYENLFIVTKDNGVTNVRGFSNLNGEEKKIIKKGFMRNWLTLLPYGNLTLADMYSHDFLLVLEGKDDKGVWKEFIDNDKYFLSKNVKVVEKEGKDNAIKIAVLLKLLKDFGIHSLPFLLILDSDNKKEDKEKRLEKEGLEISEYYILDEKEIESYLLNSAIISKTITHKTIDEIEEAINTSNRGGKEKLDNVFLKLGLSKPSAGTKELLVANMAESDIPAEISSIIDKIKTKI